MSIDGKWIRKNEVREFKEGPFVEEHMANLRLNVKDKFNEASTLLGKLEFFFQKDDFDDLFPDDSFEITSLELYIDTYRRFCSFDLDDANSMRMSIEAFDNLIPKVRRILDIMKVKFYPDINSRDNDKWISAQKQYRLDKAQYLITKISKGNNRISLNEEDENLKRKSR